MWFDYANGKEQIGYLFDGEFPINDLVLDKIVFEGRQIRLGFTCKNIPEKYPAKWLRSDFNALEFGITMGGIISFECKGMCGTITCSPEIVTQKEVSTIKIEHPELSLFCESRYLMIGRISPCIDDRWD